jgi:outer membrane protein assembly factor BamB
MGVDQSTKTVIWTIEKASLGAKALSALTSSNHTVSKDYMEVPNTHLAACKSVVFDVATGEIILGDDNHPIDAFVSGDALAELNYALVKAKVDGFYRLFAIDIATNKVVWSTQLDEFFAATDAFKATSSLVSNRDFTRQLLQPAYNKGNIIYVSNKTLYAIDGKTGAIKWEVKANPAFFTINNTGEYILTVQPAGGLKAGMAGYSKKVSCFNAATGENVWGEAFKLDNAFIAMDFISDYEVVIAEFNGVQKYDVKTAKELWKKKHSGGFTNGLQITNEGIKHYWSNKIQLLDPATGKELWAKTIKLDGLDEESTNAIQKDYDKNFVIVTNNKVGLFRSSDSKKLFTIDLDKEDQVAFDDVNKKVVVATGKKVIILDPNKDTKAPAPIKAKLEYPKNLSGVYCTSKGEFVYGQSEYILIGQDKNIIAQKVYPQLKVKDILGRYLRLSSFACGFMPISNPMYNIRKKHTEEFKKNEKKRTAPRGDENIQVFVSGESSEAGDLIKLALVNKTTGEEIKQIELSKNRGVIYEINFNANVVYYYDNGNFNVMTLK